MSPSNLFLFTTLILTTRVSASTTWCSHDKLETPCACEYVTHKRTHLPSFTADCTGANLNDFPNRENIPRDVQSLDMAYNKIDELFPQDFTGESLEILILSHNRIRYIANEFFLHMPNLTVLDLSYNQLESFEGWVFNGLERLISLDVSFNNINTLPGRIFAPLKSLSVLNVSQTELGGFLVGFDNLVNSTLLLTPKITHLEMNTLGIERFKNGFFNGVNSLKYLTVVNNPLSEPPVLPDSVEFLDLSGTQLTTLIARHFNYHKLKTLKLNRLRKLTTIDKYAFYNLLALESLSLDDCPKLRNLTDEAFGIISKDMYLPLKHLSIARSGLQRLNQSYAVVFAKLDHIHLDYNPWKCDCNLMWLRDFNASFHHPQNMRCSLPLRLRDRQFMLQDETLDLQCGQEKGFVLSDMLLPTLGFLVLILVGLIIYLLYMGPLIYGDRFVVSPRSPYQGMTTVQDE